jgi:hypothetical protein
MKCERCQREVNGGARRCPNCGAKLAESGVFQTSTVLISVGGAASVYRSVEEVPAPLRTELEKSTNGTNSATILIADRRGRREIARALKGYHGSAQRGLSQAILSGFSGGSRSWPAPPSWLTRRRQTVILFALAILAILATAAALVRSRL